MEWILTHIISPLLLPLFIIIILCYIAGARAETVAKMVIDAFIVVVKLIFELSMELIKLFWNMFVMIVQILRGKICEIPPPKGKKPPSSPKKPGPKPKQPKPEQTPQDSDEAVAE